MDARKKAQIVLEKLQLEHQGYDELNSLCDAQEMKLNGVRMRHYRNRIRDRILKIQLEIGLEDLFCQLPGETE